MLSILCPTITFKISLFWRLGDCLDLFALNMSTVFLFRNFVSFKEKSFALCKKSAWTLCASHRGSASLTQTFYTSYNGVVKVTNIEPFDEKILANLGMKCNIFHRLILLMKLDMQTYCNFRIRVLFILNSNRSDCIIFTSINLCY